MRWDKVVTLYRAVTEADSEGNHSERRADEVTVFANSRHMGFESRNAAKSMGLHADASVQVRSWEYSGQDRCVICGVEYEVEDVYDTGEYATLTLKRRAQNA